MQSGRSFLFLKCLAFFAVIASVPAASQGAEIAGKSLPETNPATTVPGDGVEPGSFSVANPFSETLSCDGTDCDWFAEKSSLTGDWFGLRPKLADEGATFNIYGTQFYQGVADGGRSQEGEYGGKFDYLAHISAARLGNPGLFLDLHGESRLGTSVNQIDGLIAPSNIAMNFPTEEGNVSALTGFKVTQALGEDFAVFAGKLNTLDEYPLHFNKSLGLDRPGIGGFMNTSLVFNPIVARTVPYSAAAVGAAFLKEGESLFSLTIMDPRERATIGLEDLYADGVVIMPDLTLHGEFLGRPSTINLGGTYSTAVYTSVDPASYLVLPSGIVAGQKRGSWSLYANVYHALWVDPRSEDRHWGIFGQFGLSDGDPNPVRFVANGGIAGRSMLPNRTRDTFGVAFFYLGLSDNFKALAAPVLPQQDEIGGELFYNFSITP